ncbi:MAG: hypothetical protein ACFCUU_10300 [Cyclobacteriaceae bacterium]
MENYVLQLIEDIRAATKKTPHPKPTNIWGVADIDELEEFVSMAGLEEYSNGTPVILSKLVGIKREQLPPLHKFSKRAYTDLLRILYQELVAMLTAYRLVLNFPKRLPLDYRYIHLRKVWDKEVVSPRLGLMNIEFCDYEPSSCPFPAEYCICKDIDVDSDLDEMPRGSNLQDDDDEDLNF